MGSGAPGDHTAFVNAWSFPAFELGGDTLVTLTEPELELNW